MRAGNDRKGRADGYGDRDYSTTRLKADMRRRSCKVHLSEHAGATDARRGDVRWLHKCIYEAVVAAGIRTRASAHCDMLMSATLSQRR